MRLCRASVLLYSKSKHKSSIWTNDYNNCPHYLTADIRQDTDHDVPIQNEEQFHNSVRHQRKFTVQKRKRLSLMRLNAVTSSFLTVFLWNFSSQLLQFLRNCYFYLSFEFAIFPKEWKMEIIVKVSKKGTRFKCLDWGDI